MSTPTSCNGRILILVLLAISIVYGNARSLSKEEYMELKAQLKLLNKPAVKSILTQHGDIDCVDMYKQPAFDHPLLKNHTIQMRPTSYPEGMGNQDPSNANLEIGLKDDGCPLGTVPIRRTKIQELMSAKSPSQFGRKNLKNRRLSSTVGHHVYGTQATMNVWSPQLQDQGQFSLAQLWLLNGHDDQLNSIEAGWQVNPDLYGDLVPRLFVYWTADGYRNTGCYNLFCPGFVQVSSDVAVGSIIQPSSTYNGDQIETTFLVFKVPHISHSHQDPSTGNWWLIYGDIQVGYWPKSLFTSLADSSTLVEWGGEVFTDSTQNPQMGSGHFPDEGFKKASYMKKLMFVDNTNILRDIPSDSPLYQDLPQCYKVIDGGNSGTDWGRYIYFGGPGGC